MNRAFGIVVTLAWVLAMIALVQRDVVPFWAAQDPPRQVMPAGKYQIGIHNEAGRRLGTTWIATASPPSGAKVHSLTVLDLGGIAGFLPIPGQLTLETILSYETDGTLDQFEFVVHGTGMPIEVKGIRYGRDFACTATLGSIHRTMPLDARVSQCLGESLRPFTHLKDLHVGQTWRIRLLDPFALIQSQTLEFQTRLTTVTARETTRHLGRSVDCFRIEAPGTVAWADDSGRVLRQEVHLPLLGKWILTDEPFDREARLAARKRVRRSWQPDGFASDLDTNP